MSATITVSEELRHRINRDARVRGVSAAALIERPLDAHERRARMELIGQAFRGANHTYWDEYRSWDVPWTTDLVTDIRRGWPNDVDSSLRDFRAL